MCLSYSWVFESSVYVILCDDCVPKRRLSVTNHIGMFLSPESQFSGNNSIFSGWTGFSLALFFPSGGWDLDVDSFSLELWRPVLSSRYTKEEKMDDTKKTCWDNGDLNEFTVVVPLWFIIKAVLKMDAKRQWPFAFSCLYCIPHYLQRMLCNLRLITMFIFGIN